MTSQDEITRTAERLKDALGAAAGVMMAGDSPVRTRGSGTGDGHDLLEFGPQPARGRPRPQPSLRRLRPLTAAASVVVIALVAAGVSYLTGNTGGPAISPASLGPVPRMNSAPDPAVLRSPGYLAARSRVVKIIGSAPSCGKVIEGSGFVYAPQRVMTTAHVVAGVTRSVPPAKAAGPAVTTSGGETFRTRVVFYDPQIDIAVLNVPGLNLAPLRFSTQVNLGDNAAVAGYPENRSFTGVAARITQVQRAEGPDIYQSSQVERQIYKIRAVVQEGNSGGPLLSPSGTVDGVVLAAAVGVPSPTGFALTSAEIQADATAGATATAPVSTQRCT
jgi:S1-C subfamily serine protease